MQFDYFYGNEAEQFTFYRIPKNSYNVASLQKKYPTVLSYFTVLCLTE